MNIAATRTRLSLTTPHETVHISIDGPDTIEACVHDEPHNYLICVDSDVDALASVFYDRANVVDAAHHIKKWRESHGD